MPCSWTRDPARHLLGLRLRVARRSGLADVGARSVSSSTRLSYGRYGGDAQSEFEARTDGVRDERLAKASTHSMLGPPSGAVGRDDDTRNKGAKVVED